VSDPGGLVLGDGQLRDFVARAATHNGLPAQEVPLYVDALVSADLRGVETHGVVRVPAYGRGFLQGEINPAPEYRELRRTGAVVVLDADNAIGCVAGQRAMDLAVDLAQSHGVGVVAVRNSNHTGMLAQHVLRAVDRGYVGYFVSNAPPVMAPWGGREAVISNNPVAYGFPAGAHPAVVLDMACSTVARGKIRQAAQNDKPIPEGWASDEFGIPTTDPHAAMRGLVMPMAGYKGYGLAFVNEMLAGVLPGAQLSFEVSTAFGREGSRVLDTWGVGHFAIALNIEAFQDRATYLERTDELISRMKSCPLAPGSDEILIPGEREWRLRQDREANGIVLSATTLALINEAAEEWGLDPLAAAVV
jgi:LDH2 family malate/lactate/ureidoglycolate dehydrogenase